MQSQLTFYNLKSIPSRKALYCILTENQYQIVRTVKQSNQKFVKNSKMDYSSRYKHDQSLYRSLSTGTSKKLVWPKYPILLVK